MLAKLRIAAVPDRPVVRQRLLDRLDTGVHRPLTLVSAPAGSGKTVLVASWAASAALPGPLIWVTVDEGDTRLGVFWSYVLAGLSRSGVAVSQVGAPAGADIVDQSFLIRLAASLYQHPDPVVLILDDAELLTSRAVWAGLEFLISHAAPQLRLMVATRVDPPLPLARYRLTGLMSELRLPELAFSLEETRAVLAGHGVNLSDRALIGLTERTKGWAAAVQLAATSMQHRPDSDRVADGISGDRGDIGEYLLAEVLDAQPPALREFLLRTSIAAHVGPGLAKELTGRRDCTRTFALLAHANAFVEPCPEHRDCYRYHPLFGDMLRAQLGYQAPGRLAQLHRKAARWLAREGQLTDAVRHATAIGDWTYAATLVVDNLAVSRILVGPDSARFAAIFADLPDDLTEPEPVVVRAALSISDGYPANGDSATSAAQLSRIDEIMATENPQWTNAVRLAILVVDSTLAGSRGQTVAALTAAGTAEDLAAEMSTAGVPIPRDLRALILFCKGTAQLRAGQLESAGATLATGVQAADAPGLEQIRVRCLGQLALVEAMLGQLRRGLELAMRADVEAEQCGLAMEKRPVATDVALAWVRTEQYELMSAHRHAEVAAATRRLDGDPVAAAALALVRSRLLRSRGNIDGAARTIQEVATAAGPPPAWLGHRLAAADAVVQVARGRADLAVRSLEGSAHRAVPATALALGWAWLADGQTTRASSAAAAVLQNERAPLDGLVEGWLLRAACEVERGDPEVATAALHRALGLAEPEGMRRLIFEAPPSLLRLLRQSRHLSARHTWLSHPALRAPRTRSAAVVAASSPMPAPAPAAAVIVESLTEKEREVLAHLEALLSTDEIAAAMFVSVNTVRTHVRGILRKLAVSRRNEAIRRARELQLIRAPSSTSA